MRVIEPGIEVFYLVPLVGAMMVYPDYWNLGSVDEFLVNVSNIKNECLVSAVFLYFWSIGIVQPWVRFYNNSMAFLLIAVKQQER